MTIRLSVPWLALASLAVALLLASHFAGPIEPEPFRFPTVTTWPEGVTP